MRDLISRQALCEYAMNQKDKSVTPNDIMRFPPAQPERCEDCENFSKARLLIPQPEIIHCRECKHRDKDGECGQYDDGTVAVSCKVPDDHYCGYAERITDE